MRIKMKMIPHMRRSLYSHMVKLGCLYWNGLSRNKTTFEICFAPVIASTSKPQDERKRAVMLNMWLFVCIVYGYISTTVFFMLKNTAHYTLPHAKCVYLYSLRQNNSCLQVRAQSSEMNVWKWYFNYIISGVKGNFV